MGLSCADNCSKALFGGFHGWRWWCIWALARSYVLEADCVFFLRCWMGGYLCVTWFLDVGCRIFLFGVELTNLVGCGFGVEGVRASNFSWEVDNFVGNVDVVGGGRLCRAWV